MQWHQNKIKEHDFTNKKIVIFVVSKAQDIFSKSEEIFLGMKEGRKWKATRRHGFWLTRKRIFFENRVFPSIPQWSQDQGTMRANELMKP